MPASPHARRTHSDQGEDAHASVHAGPGQDPKSAGGIFVGLIPWILFTLIAEHGTLKLASIAALVIAVAVCLYSAHDGGRPKMIEIAAMWGGIFTVMTASHVVAGAANEHKTNIIFNWVIPILLVVWGTKQSGVAKDAPAAQRAS